jgi:hypothetical protein
MTGRFGPDGRTPSRTRYRRPAAYDLVDLAQELTDGGLLGEDQVHPGQLKPQPDGTVRQQAGG